MQQNCGKALSTCKFKTTFDRSRLFCKSFPGIWLISLLLLLISLHATAQKSLSDTSRSTAITLGLHGHYGFIIPHSSEVREISDSYPRGVELDVSFHFTDSAAWQYLQGYPRLGASLAYFNFGNPEVLGNGYSLVVFTEPFLSAQKKFSLSFRLGLGIAYLDNVYDPETNPENLFYSTAISFPLVANLMVNYRLNERYLLRAGASYNHISNAGMRQPNKGINYPTITAGFNYAIRTAPFPQREPEKAITTNQDRYFLVALLAGAKDSRTDNTKKLPLIGITAYLSQRIGRINGLVAGAEWVADYTIREHLQKNNDRRGFTRAGLLAGHEFLIGRFRFSQQLGVYVYAPYPAYDPVYQRYGLEYHTENKLFLGINLKAHRHVADFFDVRAGMRF